MVWIYKGFCFCDFFEMDLLSFGWPRILYVDHVVLEVMEVLGLKECTLPHLA